MAVSGVKARLMLFESGDAMAGGTPGSDQKDNNSKPVPPVLQKFRQNQLKADTSNTGDASLSASSTKPDIGRKWSKGNVGGVNGSYAAPGSESGTNTSRVNGSTASDGSKAATPGRVNISNTFLTGAAPPPLKPVIPLKKPSLTPSDSDTSATKPKVALKPPQRKPQTEIPPKPALKSPVSASYPSTVVDKQNKNETKTGVSAIKPSTVTSNGSSMFSGPIKLPSLGEKLPVLKTSSIASSVSSTSSSSSSSTKSVKSPTLTPSLSSLRSTDTNGPVDFGAKLRKTSGAGVSSPENERSKESNADRLSNQSQSATNVTKSTEIQAHLSQEITSKRGSDAETHSGEMSNKAIIERVSDRKRFKKVDVSSLPSMTSQAPEKPSLPSNGVDLSLICQQHARMLQGLGGEEDEDEYTEGSSVDIRSPTSNSDTSRVSRISLIPEMSAEEEGLEEEEIYDDGMTPIPEGDLLYVDAASESKPADIEDAEDIYEDEATIMMESEEVRKRRLKEEAEAKKKEEKRQKEEEKKKKQEEKEEKRRQKAFKLTGNEKNVGQGEIKENAKGNRGKNVMPVKKGQKVMIIRLNDNPSNMWLVKTDSDMGYVESSNIEIDPNIIRQAMESHKKESISNGQVEEEDDEQPLYDDVAAESPCTGGAVEAEEEEEEVYECVQ